MMAWEWVVSITKTHEHGGAWLYEWHAWDGGEDDHQAFTALKWAKKYGGDSGVERYEKVSNTHWRGLVKEEGENDG